jgi:hypothetical protein
MPSWSKDKAIRLTICQEITHCNGAATRARKKLKKKKRQAKEKVSCEPWTCFTCFFNVSCNVCKSFLIDLNLARAASNEGSSASPLSRPKNCMPSNFARENKILGRNRGILVKEFSFLPQFARRQEMQSWRPEPRTEPKHTRNQDEPVWPSACYFNKQCNGESIQILLQG